MQVPADQVSTLLSLPNVTAVQSDTLEQPLTDSSTTFIGAPTIWNQEGGQALAGKGVIFADLDSGVWPEHPSFADNPALGSPPATEDGHARACDFGDNPLTPATDVYQCNHKLIGGQAFLDTYNKLVGGETFPHTARDSEGHGTHTTSTAAGGIVDSTQIFGIDRGKISGVAPGAWVLEYKICGEEGCFGSDAVAAIAQAIADGANVINFSISGGKNPYTDAVELAFLDAYDAGITVAASAGNSGPTAGTTDHQSPWVITVAASTQVRSFQSTLTLTDGAASTTLVGASITHGVSSPTPVVLAENIPNYTKVCGTPLPPGAAAGVIVACERGGTNANGAVGRIQKGFNVKQGGAVGMILYNPTPMDTETDNHWLPAVHLADGTQFKAFMSAHPAATATFTDGVKATAQGDVMASFSSRGPGGGSFLKPDITAPGVQILAGQTPIPDDPLTGGPPGELYQAIAGTSMSAPHIAGSAILLKALHPDWSPGAIKSALMTTAKTTVVKEDEQGVAPATPFDDGSGRVDLTVAGKAPIVFADTAENMVDIGKNPLTAMNLNLPSIDVPTMPGSITLTRTATNVSKKAYNYVVSVDSPDRGTIRVSPSSGKIKPGQSQTFEISIKSNAPSGQYFGQINLLSTTGIPPLHLPVAFFNQQGNVTTSQSCTPTSVAKGAKSTCTVKLQNTSFEDTAVVATSTVTDELKVTDATGAAVDRRGTTVTAGPIILSGEKDAVPAIAPGDTPGEGFLDLSAPPFNFSAIPIGDESVLNFNVSEFTYGQRKYSRIGVVSNGYIVVGGGTADDVDFQPQTFPNPTRPNNVLAPYWTDLDGTGSPGIYVGELNDGAHNWIVVQWNVHLFGAKDATREMQVWIGTNGVDDISYAYADSTIGQGAPADPGLTVGAENASGTAGAQITGPPAGSYVVSTTAGAPAESFTYTMTVKGVTQGTGTLKTTMMSDIVAGTTIVKSKVKVT